MATVTASTPASGAAASGVETKPEAQSGPTKLDQIAAKVKADAHATGKHIARRLHDIEKANAKHVRRAKRAIKADVAQVKKATRKLGAKLRKKN